ncbi:MAG: alpha/beta hydrolase [Actinomycetota bacterium]
MPFTARDVANRVWLEEQLVRVRAELEGEFSGHEFQGGYDEGVRALRVAELQVRLEALESVQSSLAEAVPGGPRFLIGLTGDSPPLAQVSIGNLDTATDVTYAIPGMNTSTRDTAGWVDPSQNIYDEQYRVSGAAVDSGRFAVVAWIGYKTPPIPVVGGGSADFGVLGADYARVGADRLGGDLSGFSAVRPGVRVNVVSHSYGTTTASLALSDREYGVDSFVMLASAGLGEGVSDVEDVHAREVFVAQAPNVPRFPKAEVPTEWFVGDPWAQVGRTFSGRADPVGEEFGATLFGADGERVSGEELYATTAHDALVSDDGGFGYFDKRTESLYNVALVTTGQGGDVTGDQTHRAPVETVAPGLVDEEEVF